MLCKIEEIDNNLKGLESILFALAAHAENGVFIDEDCLLLLAHIVGDTQKISKEALNEVSSNAKKKKGGEAA